MASQGLSSKASLWMWPVHRAWFLASSQEYKCPGSSRFTEPSDYMGAHGLVKSQS